VLSGKTYLKANFPEQAIECFEEAVSIDQSNAGACFCLGKAYLRVGDSALALEQQRKLEALDPQLAQDLSVLIMNKNLSE
jgi:Flp pilus assembly protein TadD